MQIAQLLIQNKINVTAVDSTLGNTALHYASTRGMKDIVELLLSNPDPSNDSNPAYLALLQTIKACNTKNHTPVVLGLHSRSKQAPECVLFMIKKLPEVLMHEYNKGKLLLLCLTLLGLDPAYPIKTTILFEVLRAPPDNGHEVLKQLMEDADQAQKFLTLRTATEQTLLHVVCEQKHAKAVGLLLIEKGIDINAQDANGRTCLHVALETPDCDIVEPLILSGKIRLDFKDKTFQQTVLHKCATQKTHAKHIEKLLGVGANPNEQDINGNTSLMVAILFENWDAVIRLASRVNVNLANLKQQMPIIIALKLYTKGKLAAAALEMLVEKGADVTIVDHEDSDEANLIILGVEKDVPDKILSLLIQKGANVNYQTKNSKLTALHMACEQRDVKLVSCLVENGANMFIPDNTQSIPLVYAVANSNQEVTDYILSKIYDSEEYDDDQITKLRAQALISKLGLNLLDALMLEFVRQNVELDLAVSCYKQLMESKLRQHNISLTPAAPLPTLSQHLGLQPQIPSLNPMQHASIMSQLQTAPIGQQQQLLHMYQQLFQQQQPHQAAFHPHMQSHHQHVHPQHAPAQVIPTAQLAENLQIFHDASDNNASLFMIACQEGHSHVAYAYLDWCSIFKSVDGVTDHPLAAVLSDRNALGSSPLHYLCSVHDTNQACEINAKVEMLVKFIRRGADFNIQNNDGDTPLHIACKNGYAPLVQNLIGFGARQDLVNNKGQTAEQLGQANGHYNLTSKRAANDGIAASKRSRKRAKTVERLLKDDDDETNKEAQDLGDESEDEYKTPDEESDDDDEIVEEPDDPQPQQQPDDDFDDEEDDEEAGDGEADFRPAKKRKLV